MARPMLDDVELEHVQKIEVDGDQVLIQHGVPALEGDFLQGLGRRATQITLTGVLTGPEAGEGLNTLRDKFRAAEPISFVADITTATRVDQVLIEEMGVRELAGRPERFEYAFTLREFIPPPEPEEEPPEIEEPENPAENIDQGVGILIVEVSVEDHPTFDFSKVTLTIRGTQEDGTELLRTLSNRTDNTWTEEEFPAGQYTVEAVASASAAITGSAPTDVQAGETTRTNVTLHPGTIIAKSFVIHFRFDSAFIEPCMRSVLQEVARYASDRAHESEKLLIVGHTDKVDTEDYNQSLSERRARSAHAFLTVGRDRDAALAEWHALRQERPRRQTPEIKDDWGVREYQHMLQDLGFYPGPVDGNHGSLTDDAVRAYRCQKGLPPGTNVDNAVWQHLIEDYLTQDSLAVPANRFLPNASADCDGGVLKWLGCGENSPLPQPRPTRRTAWRPYRRVEFLFVASNALPDGCEAPEPATFNLPQQGAVGPIWCLGPGDPDDRCCFGTYQCERARAGQWCIRRTVDEQTITVEVFIHDEDDNPVGNREFVLIAPDGKFKDNETSRGEPLPSRTGSNGRLSFQDMPVDAYTLEVTARRRRDYVLIRLAEGSYEDAKGNVVCKRLTLDDTSLEVVVIDAPVLREIKLPVVAHLMTAIGPDGVVHETSRTEASVRQLFDQVNHIWRQARIRFEVKDVVHKTYEPPPPHQSHVTQAEFSYLLTHCTYPNVLNVFFVQDIAAPSASYVVSFESGSDTPGCALEDRADDRESAAFLAQTLGFYLNIEGLEDQPGQLGTIDRLMHEGLVRSGTRLIDEEVDTARASQGAQQECIPLTVNVTGGATQIGGPYSPNYVVLHDDAGAPITVEAKIPPAILALGTVTMTGGAPVPGFPLRRNVVRTTTGLTTIDTTFAMTINTASGTTTEIHLYRTRISVVDFEVEVQGAIRLGESGSNIYVAEQHATDVVIIVANITPRSALPNCIPTNMIQWTAGDIVPADPFRRTISRADSGEMTVTVTFAGISRTVVIRVYDLEFVLDRAPYDTTIARTRWERSFRLRADLPGETRDEITLEIESYLIKR